MHNSLFGQVQTDMQLFFFQSTGWVPPVLAKLNPAICNYKTGQISPTDLAQVQKQAAAAGLQYDRELPVNCWYKFKQTGNATRTAAAMAALTVPKSNKTGKCSYPRESY